MAKLLAMVEERDVKAVIVAKLDRLTRSVKDPCELLERFERRGVALVSVAESLDTGSAAGRLVLNIMAAVSQCEREAIGTANNPKSCETEIRIKLPCGSRGARSRTHTCPPNGKRGLHAHGLAPDLGQPPRLIADAHQEHRLSGVLQNIDDALMLVFEVNRFAVGDQVVMRGGVQHFSQPPSHFPL
jgi:hypothetical protein